MKTSLQFFKDLGVCDGGYAAFSEVFNAHGVEYFDYDLGLVLMDNIRDSLEESATAFGEDGHDEVEGWFEWCRELKYRSEAIMYFGDHIEKNEYRTSDGLLHASLPEAEQHEDTVGTELKAGYRANVSICGIRVTEQGETWEVLRDLDTVDWSTYDKFSWSEIKGGKRFETPSPTEALAHYSLIDVLFAEIDATTAYNKEKIMRKVADNTDTYEVWV